MFKGLAFYCVKGCLIAIIFSAFCFILSYAALLDHLFQTCYHPLGLGAMISQSWIHISGSFLLLEHMDKSWMHISDRINDPRYKSGVNEFLKYAYHHKHESIKLPCPCKTCNSFRIL